MFDPQRDALAMGIGPAPIVSREALLEEDAKRPGILGRRYDPAMDLERLDPSLDDRPEPEPGPQQVPEAA